MNDLRILVSTAINTGKSIKDINKALREISKHPSLQKIKIGLEIDSNLIQTISTFNNQLKQLNRERMSQVNNSKKAVSAINKETDAIKKQTEAQKQLTVEKTKRVIDPTGQKTPKTTYTYGNSFNNDKQVVTKLDNNEVVGRIIKTTNPAKDLADYNRMLDEAYRMNEQFNKRAISIDRAHYNALKTERARREAVDKAHYMALKKNREIDLTNQAKAIKQAEQIDRAHYNALQTEKARKEALDKLHYMALKQNRERDIANQQKLTNLQLRTEQQVYDLKSRYRGKIDSAGLDSLLNQLKQISPTSANALKNASQIRTEITRIGLVARSSASEAYNFGEMLRTAFAKFPVWMLTATAFYAPIRGLQAMSQTIIQVDSQMTQLKRVMDEDTNFEKMLQSSIRLANELGQSISNVNEALIEFARQGYNENQVVSLAQTATLAQNISELSMSEATSAITAAMTVFNISAEDSIKIIDKLNEVDNNYSTTTKDLAISLTKAGSSAKTFGVSLDELLGYTTAIQSATKESGAIVGNSLKTIFSRITTMSEAETALRDVGIAITDISGNVRDVSDILEELAGKWNTLSAAQQQNTGVTLAGRYQLNRFLALMSNFSTAVSATETSLHSQGSAAIENDRYMQSLEARINLMKTSWQNLSLTMGNAVITDSLVSLISVITALGNVFSSVVDKIGLFPVVFGAAGVALYGLNSAFKALTLSMINTVRTMVGLPPVLAASSAGIRGLTISLTGLKLAFRGLLASTGVGLVLAGLGFVAEKLINAFGDAAKSTDDLGDSLTSLSDKVAEVQRIKELQIEYQNLTNKVELTVEQKTKLSEIESELQTKYGIALSALDSEGVALANNNKTIQQRIDLLTDEIKLEREKSLLNYRKQESAVDKDIANRRRELEEAKKIYDELSNKYAEFRSKSENGEIISNENNYFSKNMSSLFSVDSSSTDKSSVEAIKAMGESIAEEVNKAREKWQNANINLQKSVNIAELGLKSQFGDYVDTMQAQGKQVKDTTKLLFDALASTAALNNIKISDSELEKYFALFNSSNIKSVEDAQRVFNSLPDAFSLSGAQLEDLNNSLMKMNFAVISGETEDYIDTTSELGEALTALEMRSEKISDIFKTNSEDISYLNSTLDDLKENQHLSADATAELIQKYPELAKLAVKTADGWKIEASAIEELRKAKIQKAIDDLEQEKQNTLNTLNNTLARMNYYGLEIQSINTLAEAKKALNDLEAQKVELSTPRNQEEAMRFMSDLANNKSIDEAAGQLKQFTDLLDQIEKQKQLLNDPSLGNSSSKSKSSSKGSSSSKESKDTPRIIDATQARINAINQETKARHELNEAIEERSDELSGAEKYDIAIQKRSILLKSQIKEINILRAANKELDAERQKLDKNSKYNLSSFVDANGEATEAYYKLYNSLKSGKSQEALEDLFNKYQQYTKAILENSKVIEETGKARQQTFKDLAEDRKKLDEQRLEGTTKYLEKISRPIEDYNDQITESQKRQSLFTEGTSEYNAQQEKQLALLHEKSEYIKKEIQWAEARLKQGNLTVAQEAALNEWLKTNKDALLDTAIATKELTESRANAYKSWADKVKSTAQDTLEVLQDFYKEQGEEEKKALEKQLENYEDFINERKRLLSRQNDTEDFNKERDKLQKEASDLQAKINVFMLDNSWKAKSKREDLEKELADKLNEITELQIDRDRKLREDNLDDMLESERKRIEVAKDAVDQKWQTELEKDKYYSQLKESILQGNVENMQSILLAFSQNTQSYMDAIGRSIDKNVTEKLSATQKFLDIKNQVSDINLSTNPSTGNVTVPTTTTDTNNNIISPSVQTLWEEYLQNKLMAETLGKKDKSYQDLKNRNDLLRALYKFKDGSYAELSKSKVPIFSAETGGMTPAWGSGGKLGILHEQELVLNKQDTKNILQTVDIVRGLVGSIKTPDISKLTPQTITNSTEATKIFNFHVNVNANDRNSAERFIQKIRTHYKQNGI
ncbi:phage tail tape measure protein [Paenibacillus xylaniclasticus]|uniref:phage tail tape measure protein n=1 Tax=Paenibacillus xylaniclasticus TaxID=588083 RepID=UPI000FD79A77|nr:MULTISPECIES: phage tail tape measure protein [Paenibacillus]GFN32608.1 SPBc2 prophage-derived uncharacterized transglycosylase YomI [Paenibacillus curdlanolyticus]